MERNTGRIGAGRGSDVLLLASAVLVVSGYVAWLHGATAGADSHPGDAAVVSVEDVTADTAVGPRTAVPSADGDVGRITPAYAAPAGADRS